MSGKARLSLLCAFFSQQAPLDSSFPLEPKGKYYFAEWHTLQREGCIVNVESAPVEVAMLGKREYRCARVYNSV